MLLPAHKISARIERINRTPNAVARVVGLVICFVLAIIQAGLVLLNGPKFLPWMRGIDFTMAAFISEHLVQDPASRGNATVWSMSILYLLTGAIVASAFWARTDQSVRRSALSNAGLLAVQVMIALAFNLTLLMLVALELSLFLQPRLALKWLAAIMLALLVTALLWNARSATTDVLQPIVFFAETVLWTVFAFSVGIIVTTITRSRLKLAAAHAELEATQQLLSDTIRTSERVRIARDLHDAIGHHLTAMNLHLELAMRQAGGRATDSIRASRALAQRHLTEMRLVVGVERLAQTINFRKSLEILCSGIQSPRIALSFSEEIEVTSAALAHTVFFSIQEAIANAVRHADATELAITLAGKDDGLAVAIADNGCGADEVKERSGLHGVRERIEALGGNLQFGNRPQSGFFLQIWLPYLRAAQ